MPTPLAEATVVVTGASSGIGRAAALRFARRGARLALAARDPEPLAAIAAECEAAGAAGVLREALDVAEEAAVERLAAAAVERFGRLDVWVNGAGVIAYGDFLDIPSGVFRRVIETNLLGQVHGARAALRRFVPQRHGVLINMSSVWGRVSSPQVSPYVASKHAVRAFSESVRSEVEHLPDVYVTTVAPQAVDTPIFASAANYGGRRVRPIPPVLAAEEVAAGIEACAENPRREVTYGRAGRALEVLYSLAPPLYRRLAHPAFVAGTFAPERRAASSGNVLAPAGAHAIEGGWRRRRRDLWRAWLEAAWAALRGRPGGNGFVDTQPMPPAADRDDVQKGNERAEAAAERAESARQRADEAREEAGAEPTPEASQRYEREADLHEDAAAVQEKARRMQEEHAEEARRGGPGAAVDRES